MAKKKRAIGASYENLTVKQQMAILAQNIKTLFERINELEHKLKTLKK